jgi:hypothetical protein
LSSDGAIEYAHTLNGTAAAIPRLLISLLENGIKFEGSRIQSLELPLVLKPFWLGSNNVSRLENVPIDVEGIAYRFVAVMFWFWDHWMPLRKPLWEPHIRNHNIHILVVNAMNDDEPLDIADSEGVPLRGGGEEEEAARPRTTSVSHPSGSHTQYSNAISTDDPIMRLLVKK